MEGRSQETGRWWEKHICILFVRWLFSLVSAVTSLSTMFSWTPCVLQQTSWWSWPQRPLLNGWRCCRLPLRYDNYSSPARWWSPSPPSSFLSAESVFGRRGDAPHDCQSRPGQLHRCRPAHPARPRSRGCGCHFESCNGDAGGEVKRNQDFKRDTDVWFSLIG